MSTPTTVPAPRLLGPTARSLRTADDFARQPTPMWQLPDPKQATARIAQVLLDVMNGQRPVAQLNHLTTTSVRTQVLNSVARLTRDQRHRCVVSSLRVTTPGPSVVEASVVLRNAGRSRAMALRLEGLDGRWICTAMRLG